MTGRMNAQRTAPCTSAKPMMQRTNKLMGPVESSDAAAIRAQSNRPWIATARHGKIRRAMIPTRFGLVLLLAASCCGTSGAAEPLKAAVFDLELVDTSQESERRAATASRGLRAVAGCRSHVPGGSDTGQVSFIEMQRLRRGPRPGGRSGPCRQRHRAEDVEPDPELRGRGQGGELGQEGAGRSGGHPGQHRRDLATWRALDREEPAFGGALAGEGLMRPS